MKLTNETTKQTLVSELEVASTLWSRTKGLLGRDGLSDEQALWILRCNSVHTFFMRFAIDLVFLNKRLEVTKVLERVKPGRVVWPVLSASSVVEMKAGAVERRPVRVGDKLNVDHTVS